MDRSETRLAVSANYMQRSQVERVEDWDGICRAMPYLKFPSSWEVAVIPPFGGAVARFLVRKGKARVSVYADFYERLGCWAEPHWEIYPNAEDDNERFSITTETDAMLAAISKSLKKQTRKSARLTEGEM